MERAMDIGRIIESGVRIVETDREREERELLEEVIRRYAPSVPKEHVVTEEPELETIE